MKKRLLAITLALTTFSLSGCILRDTTKYEIAVIGIGECSGRETEMMAGVKQYAEEQGVTYRYYEAENTFDSMESAIRKAINARAKLVLVADPVFSEVVFEKQYTYEKYDFALLDALPVSFDGTRVTLTENVSCALYDSYEIGYLAGWMLKEEGYSSVGYIGDPCYLSGFVAGYGSVPVSSSEPKDAEAWYEGGVEIVLAVGDTVETVAPIASRKGKKVVGTEYDRAYLGESVLTSVVKDWRKTAYIYTMLHKAGYWRNWGENQLAERVFDLGASTNFLVTGETEWFTLSDYSKLKSVNVEKQREALSSIKVR